MAIIGANTDLPAGYDHGGAIMSYMQRAQAYRQSAELMEMKKQEFAKQQVEDAIMLPLKREQAAADVVKARTDYDIAMRTQKNRASAYELYDKAATDFDYVNQITDDKERAARSREWLSRYSQLANIKELKPQVDAWNDLATSNVMGAIKVNMLGGAEARSFDQLTKDMAPEDREAARKVKLGLQGRASGAAIQYRKVIGPDGREQLVAVDPRSVGAQVIGSGETYGSGVNPTQESRTAVTGEEPQKENRFISQTPYDKNRAEAEGTKDAEYKAKLRQDKPKRQAAIKQAEALTDQLSDDIDVLIGKVSSATAGPGGVLLDKFPGTTARDLQSNLDSIKANIGFQALQAMREASPTGGALGNVSDTENKLLQARFGSLEIGQSPSQLIENLKKIRQRIVQNYGITRAAFSNEYGDGESSSAQDQNASQAEPVVIKSIRRID